MWIQKEHYYLNSWSAWAEVFRDGDDIWKWNASVNLREYGGVAGSKEEAQKEAEDWIKRTTEDKEPSVFVRSRPETQ